MSTSSCVQLQGVDLDSLLQMKALYGRDLPKYCQEYQILKSIIHFKKSEPQMKHVRAYTLPDQRAQDLGLFLIMDRYQLFVGCLGESMEYLEKALRLLDWSNGIFCSALPNRYIATVIKVIEDIPRTSIVRYDSELYHLPAGQASQFSVACPEGFQLRRLTEEDASIVDNAWSFRHKGSLFYFQRQIRLSASVGLYEEKTKKLVAWCIRHQDGLMGGLHVVDAYKRRGFGTLLVKALSRRIADAGDVVAGEVENENRASKAMLTNLGFQMIDTIHWFVVQPAYGERTWPDGE